jgi:hypothetical protein
MICLQYFVLSGLNISIVMNFAPGFKTLLISAIHSGRFSKFRTPKPIPHRSKNSFLNGKLAASALTV